MTDYVFEDPPQPLKKGGGSVTDSFVAALRTRPGEWARYPRTYAPRVASSACSYHRRTRPDIEWVARKLPDSDEYGIWARSPE